MPSDKVTVEVEYHRTTLNDPKLETAKFTWLDGANYASPNAKSEMTFNSLLVNTMVRWTQSGEPFRASSFAPYAPLVCTKSIPDGPVIAWKATLGMSGVL